eukprot:32412_1
MLIECTRPTTSVCMRPYANSVRGFKLRVHQGLPAALARVGKPQVCFRVVAIDRQGSATVGNAEVERLFHEMRGSAVAEECGVRRGYERLAVLSSLSKQARLKFRITLFLQSLGIHPAAPLSLFCPPP